jgi:multidrug resistance efflux pump
MLRNLLAGWPFLVWLAAAGAVVWLYSGSVHFGQLTGVVESRSEDISPVVTARLLSVDVVPGQAVKAGEPLAHMDTTLVDAGIAADEAAMRSREDAARRDDAAELRTVQQLESEADGARADLAQARMELSRAQAELDELKLELARSEELLKRRLIRESDMTALRPTIASLSKAVEGYPPLIAAHQQRIDRAEAEREAVRGRLGAGPVESAAEAVRRRAEARSLAVEGAVTSRRAEREPYTLSAVTSGLVSRVYYHPGVVVVAGDPVVRVVNPHSLRIVGFLPESQLESLNVGDRVTAWRKSVIGEKVSAEVESLSPDVQALPARLNPMSSIVTRGRRVIMTISGGHTLIPGETVNVELDRMVWTDMIRNAWRGLSGGESSTGIEGGSRP